MTIPNEIVNPRSGQRMRFETGDVSLLRIESVNPPGPAEPEHVHPKQESRARVLSGSLHFSVQGEVSEIRAGEEIVIPANTPHNFWNQGDEDARAIQEFRPALHTEAFFRTYFGLARDGKLNAKGVPSVLQMAALIPTFADEIRVTNPPWAVQRLLAVLLGPIARLFRYRATFPEYERSHQVPS